jgi:hypothetical protein
MVGYWDTICKKVRKILFGTSDELLWDSRFELDEVFFNRRIKFRNLRRYEISKMKLKDIKRGWKGKMLSLEDVSPFKFLQGDIEDYEEYCNIHQNKMGHDVSIDKYKDLIKNIEEKGFDTKKIIVVGYNDEIVDGQHRCCYLLYKFGREHEIDVLKVDLCKRTLVGKIMHSFFHLFNRDFK